MIQCNIPKVNLISNSKRQLRTIDYFLLRRINDQSIIADIFLEPAKIYMYSVIKARYKDSWETHYMIWYVFLHNEDGEQGDGEIGESVGKNTTKT